MSRLAEGPSIIAIGLNDASVFEGGFAAVTTSSRLCVFA
jgi:hypothetical protein